jgi:outer membrane protein
MNKPCISHLPLWSIILGTVLLTSNGCFLFPSNRDLHGRIVVPPVKLHKVAPLQLPKAKEQKQPITDVNETPAETLELTLEQCRAMALQNNLELRATLIDPSIAEEQVKEERARFEATFTANASKTKWDRPFMNELSGLRGTQGEQDRLSVGLNQPFVSGGTASLSVTDVLTETNATDSISNPLNEPESQFSFTQPLLRNAGPRTLTSGIRLANIGRQIADAQTKLAVISILSNLDRAYWLVYSAQRELEVRKQQYKLAQTQLESAQRLVESGQRAEIEVLRAQAGVTDRLEAIIIAQNALGDRQRALKRLMNRQNLDMQTPTLVTPATEPVLQRYDFDPDHLVSSALENRMEILVLELQVLQDLDIIDFRKNQALPLINFTYQYNIGAAENNRRDAYQVLEGSQFAGHYFGLSAQIPLGNQAAKSSLRQILLQRIQRLSTKKNRENLIKSEVLNAAEQLRTNWQRILASQQNAIVSGRLYEAEKRQFEQGQRTSTVVLDAQNNLDNAQLAELSALVGYQIALVDLAHATGTLLGSAQVEWQARGLTP